MFAFKDSIGDTATHLTACRVNKSLDSESLEDDRGIDSGTTFYLLPQTQYFSFKDWMQWNWKIGTWGSWGFGALLSLLFPTSLFPYFPKREVLTPNQLLSVAYQQNSV